MLRGRAEHSADFHSVLISFRGVSTKCPQYSVPECQFNAAAFSDPGNGVFGNAGRNILRGPSFAQVDFSIFKNTKLTETTSLQLRMEVFNIFNKANFADPSGGLNSRRQ